SQRRGGIASCRDRFLLDQGGADGSQTKASHYVRPADQLRNTMMTRRTNRRARGWATRTRMLVVVPALAVPAFVAGAQSNLSSQGFGFPSGQFSTRAQGTGGAVGEMDPFSPINPATIGAFTSRILFFQMEPEYRS